MNLKQVLCGLSVFSSIFITHLSFADTSALPSNSRLIVGGKIILPSSGTGTLLGFGDVHYESENFYIGGAAYTGQISSGGISGSFSEGGILAGYLFPYTSSINIIAQAMVGAGGGSQGSISATGFLAQPSIGLDFATGRSMRLVADVGYTYIPASSTFSGFQFDVALHFLN